MPNLCIVPARVLENKELTARDLRTLLAIGTFTDRDGQGVWASKRTLAALAGIDERHLRRSVKRLVEWGYVTQDHRKDEDGNDLTAMLAIVLQMGGQIGQPRGAETASGGRAKSASPRGAKSASQTTHKNDPSERVSDTGSAPPSVEPQGEAAGDPWPSVRAAYPARSGSQGWPKAEERFRRWVKQGVDPTDILAGVERYAMWAEATGKAGTEYVMQAQTFFGPNQAWTETYAVPQDAALVALVEASRFDGYTVGEELTFRPVLAFPGVAA